MSEHVWSWVIWILGLLLMLLLAIPTFGFTLVFVLVWWVGGPFYASKDGEFAPSWSPLRRHKLWWRNIR